MPVPIDSLPLPTTILPLQHALPRLPLPKTPSAQRRSTIFKSSTDGIWAPVTPLWAPWPIRLSPEEAIAMGYDPANPEGLGVDEILGRWDPVDSSPVESKANGLIMKSSRRRLEMEPIILAVSPRALQEVLPALDPGDILSITRSGTFPDSPNAARDSFIDILSTRKVLSSDTYGPWSTRYAGHQFGAWAGQLGDGRAVSVLETESEQGGRQEIQLKGAGRTPFSRTDDGLAALKGGLKEFLGSEATAALGIPTTRALALHTHPLSTLPVFRSSSLSPASILARVSPSFIRIGHFEALSPPEGGRGGRQVFLGLGTGSGGGREEWVDNQAEKEDEAEEGDPKERVIGNLEGLRDLALYMKALMGSSDSGLESWKGWIFKIIELNAKMVAKWQVYGYMNGVINTDNVTLLGLTIDYGPFAYMEVFDEGHICNEDDTSGLYAYRHQPSRILFALQKFATSIAPLVGYLHLNHGALPQGYTKGSSKEDVKEWATKGEEVMKGWNWEEEYWSVQKGQELDGWRARLGLKTVQESDQKSIRSLLSLLHDHRLDFHSSFRALAYFDPIKASSDSEEGDYLPKFARRLVQEAGRGKGSHEDKTEELEKWLAEYVTRAGTAEERAAWSSSSSDFLPTRLASLLSLNPSFVLRPSILSSLGEKVEVLLTAPYKDATSKDDLDNEKVERGIVEARREIWNVLERAFDPFKDCNDDKS
ncbi:hypothetical protein L198_00091 [Cryptococcus wingfieldii CBS 7118]|uniref:Selenoprotein O n=1 Tax=Cryptococcus wingfieldii CBS 7118 TaxID=1295528 RepID=A0A1E3K604_9TREE|nr:hypothetical protein L198_00091 [Cryptococcus wingfieldii CBS 7118]ODO08366.1 hypothetical protein L198_00091 [Cryptococcus wingfieldii CBS 7118]